MIFAPSSGFSHNGNRYCPRSDNIRCNQRAGGEIRLDAIAVSSFIATCYDEHPPLTARFSRLADSAIAPPVCNKCPKMRRGGSQNMKKNFKSPSKMLAPAAKYLL